MTKKKAPVAQDGNRDNKGRFVKGKTGNAGGRPKSESAILREKLQQNADKVFELLMAKLDEGDSAALKLCLDRLVPPLKATTAPVQIEFDGESLSDKANGVFGAAINGNVSADTASQLISALAGVAKISEITELEQRITALEEKDESK